MQPHSEWDALDFALYEAHGIWKAETSSTTGHPLWLTRSLHPAVTWRIEESVDYADAALDEWDKAHPDRVPGMSRFAVPDAPDDLLEGGLAREAHLRMTYELQQGGAPDDESAGLDIDRKRPPEGWNPADYG